MMNVKSQNAPVYEVCPQSIHPCNIKTETFMGEDTRNTAHRTLTPQASPQEAPGDLTQLSQAPSAARLISRLISLTV